MTSTHPQTSAADVRAQRPRAESRPARRTFTETKLGTKTSEFYLALAGIAAVLIATYMDSNDSLAVEDGWFYASLIVVGYVLSRGFAKLGTREPYTDSE